MKPPPLTSFRKIKNIDIRSELTPCFQEPAFKHVQIQLKISLQRSQILQMLFEYAHILPVIDYDTNLPHFLSIMGERKIKRVKYTE